MMATGCWAAAGSNRVTDSIFLELRVEYSQELPYGWFLGCSALCRGFLPYHLPVVVLQGEGMVLARLEHRRRSRHRRDAVLRGLARSRLRRTPRMRLPVP